MMVKLWWNRNPPQYARRKINTRHCRFPQFWNFAQIKRQTKYLKIKWWKVGATAVKKTHSSHLSLLMLQNPALIMHLLSSLHDVGGPIQSILVINTVSVHLQGLSYWLCLRFSRWSLNGTLIDLGNDYRRHMSGGNLIISNLDKDQDIGMYQCTAYTTWGSILSRRASLQFACKWSYSWYHAFGTAMTFWHLFVSAVYGPDMHVIWLWPRLSFFLFFICYSDFSFRLPGNRFSRGEMVIEWNVSCNKHSGWGSFWLPLNSIDSH